MPSWELETTIDEYLIKRYLHVLGVSPLTPSLSALTKITTAHLTRIPFENISKLYRKRRFGFTGLPDVQTFLDGVEHYHFGGTCYANNFYLYCLLKSLGYEVELCGADMSRPDVHVVSMLALEGREYLVDAGYGAPFLEPLPRDLDSEYVIALGRSRYVLKPQDANGCSRMDLDKGDGERHGYLAKPAPKRIEDFSEAIADSFRREATFMNALLLTRFWPGRSVMIHNMTVTEARGMEWKTRRLGSRAELLAEIEMQFGMPREVVKDAIAGLRELRNAFG